MIAQPSKLLAYALLPSLMFLTPLTSASAQQSVVEEIRTECKTELNKYCSTVTPGRGRYAGCLFAHNDKLSERCGIVFEAGLLQLSIILSTLDYVVEQCAGDIDEHCDGVVVGGGRIARCLSKNLDNLKPACKGAYVKAKADLQ